MKRQCIDEKVVLELTREIDNQFLGKGVRRPLHEIIAQLESLGPFAGEFISRLKTLDRRGHQRTNIDDVLGLTTRIGMRASMWNHGIREIEERERHFRVEISQPTSTDRSPVVFIANVYLESNYAATIRCAVYDEDIADWPLGNKSLSKRAARNRRLDECWSFFVQDFPLDLEKQWKAGQDLTKLKEIRWSQVH